VVKVGGDEVGYHHWFTLAWEMIVCWFTLEDLMVTIKKTKKKTLVEPIGLFHLLSSKIGVHCRAWILVAPVRNCHEEFLGDRVRFNTFLGILSIF
jgi:hypothetical protein